MAVLADLAESFVLGVLTPLGAVCVLPLYPGFLAYLSNRLDGRTARRGTILRLALFITGGVVAFMFLLGLLFTTILQVSLTRVIGVVSPVAFGILLVLSVLLLFDVDVGRFLPKGKVPKAKSASGSALLYGFFFGAIVVPCNPLFIAIFFTRSVSVLGFGANLLRFLAFGVGIAAPLLALAVLSTAASGAVIAFLTRYKTPINRIAGALMLGISTYYLFFVFRVLDPLLG
jgi:cytochrome c-type biogenesis protein